MKDNKGTFHAKMGVIKGRNCMDLTEALEKTDAGKDWGQEEKGTAEDEMAQWHHWLNGRESEWTQGWWWTGRPGVLWFMGSQRVGHDWVTELNWTEAEDIKKRYEEYTEELYKKHHHDWDNHDGVITHLEPDILECKVK